MHTAQLLFRYSLTHCTLSVNFFLLCVAAKVTAYFETIQKYESGQKVVRRVLSSLKTLEENLQKFRKSARFSTSADVDHVLNSILERMCPQSLQEAIIAAESSRQWCRIKDIEVELEHCARSGQFLCRHIYELHTWEIYISQTKFFVKSDRFAK